MFNAEAKVALLSEFSDNFEKMRKENLSDLPLVKYMEDEDAELVKKSVEKIANNVIASFPDEMPVPGTVLYVRSSSTGEEGITLVNITMGSKLNATKKFKFANSFAKEATIVDRIADYFKECYSVLFENELAESNVIELNELLDEAVKEAGVDFKVSLAAPVVKRGAIEYLSDDEVVFNVDMDRIFGIAGYTDELKPIISEDKNYLVAMLKFKSAEELLLSEEEFEEAKKDAVRMIAESIATAQTTIQLVNEKGGCFISYFAGIAKTSKTLPTLKKSFIKSINTVGNTGVGYYLKDNVYALIAKQEGAYSVLLSPFDTETFRNVDVDVLKGLE